MERYTCRIPVFIYLYQEHLLSTIILHSTRARGSIIGVFIVEGDSVGRGAVFIGSITDPYRPTPRSERHWLLDATLFGNSYSEMTKCRFLVKTEGTFWTLRRLPSPVR
jgi:hypothetical protein